MKIAEMTSKAQADRLLFMDRLSAAGWEVESWDAVLEQGDDVEPEAEAEYAGPEFDLRLEFHASGPYLAFELDQREGDLFLNLRLYPAVELGEILARIVDAQDTLNGHNMADVVKTLIPLCDPLLIDTEEGLQQLSL